MNRSACVFAWTLPFALLYASPGAGSPPSPGSAAVAPANLPGTEEATARARLLHGAIDGALRVMHRDFFRKGDNKAIPSESLQDVFKTLAEEQGVTLRWLASEETIMNVDHKARDEFQKKALTAMAAGEREYRSVEKDTLRFAGTIVLQNQCLKCHVPDRKSLEDRYAALEIVVPVKPGSTLPQR